MMNKTLIQLDKAIAIMKRAKNLNMKEWQKPNYDHSEIPRIVSTEEELHACGNTACFAGYVAISPEFKADGGRIGRGGAPVLSPIEPRPTAFQVPEVIAQWLGITVKEADSLVYGDIYAETDESTDDMTAKSHYYQKEWLKVEPQDVIEKLEELKVKYA